MIFLVGDVAFLRFVAVLVVMYEFAFSFAFTAFAFSFAFTAFGGFSSRKDLDLCLNLDLDRDLDLERKDRALLLLVLPSLEQLLISSEEIFSLPWCPLLLFIKDDGNRIFMVMLAIVTIPVPCISLDITPNQTKPNQTKPNQTTMARLVSFPSGADPPSCRQWLNYKTQDACCASVA
jgi:hypothetical protein